MPDLLSEDDLTELRTDYLQDRFVAPDDGNPSGVALSHFNIANQRAFTSDTTLQNIARRLELDKRTVLDRLRDDKITTEFRSGETMGDAQATGAALRRDALFRLIRGVVWVSMMNDAGFSAAFADVKERASMYAAWRRQIEADTAFTARRAAGLGSLDLVQG